MFIISHLEEEEHFPKFHVLLLSLNPTLLSKISPKLTIENQRFLYQINPHQELYKTHTKIVEERPWIGALKLEGKSDIFKFVEILKS